MDRYFSINLFIFRKIERKECKERIYVDVDEEDDVLTATVRMNQDPNYDYEIAINYILYRVWK